MKKRNWFRGVVAAIAAVSVLSCTSVTALAESVTYDSANYVWRCIEDDGSVGANKWAQNDWGDWFYFGPDGTSLTIACDKPYPLLVGLDGSIIVDERIRSATGVAGQQPVMSVPSSQKDILYKGLRQTLDSIPLYPDAQTGLPELDAMLDAIFAQIITPDMDTHDKLKACYDYLVVNMKDDRYDDLEEGQGMVITLFTEEDLDNPISGTYYTARDLLQGGVGVCDTFSATFAVMAWKLGVPMYLVGGYTSRSGGGYTGHTWCQLDGPDGITYIFDPHIDHLITIRGGALSHARFGAPQSRVATKYVHICVYHDL